MLSRKRVHFEPVFYFVDIVFELLKAVISGNFEFFNFGMTFALRFFDKEKLM